MKKLFIFTIFLLIFSSSSVLLASDEYVWQPNVVVRGDDYQNDFYGGNFVERADGKFLVAYRIDNKAMLSVVDSEQELLTVENTSAQNEWVFHTFYIGYESDEKNSQIQLQKLLNGHILLYLSEYGVEGDPTKPYRLDVYESVNGLGTDFVLKSNIYEQELPEQTAASDRSIGQAIEFGGAIMIPFTAPMLATSGFYEGYVIQELYCAISKNGGASWSFSRIAPRSGYWDDIKGFGIAGDRIIVLVQKWYALGTTTMYSHLLQPLLNTEEDQGVISDSNASTWDYDEDYNQLKPIDMLNSHIFWQPDGYTYLLRDSGFEDTNIESDLYWVYRRKSNVSMEITGQSPYEIGPVGSGATWEGPLNPEAYGDDAMEFFTVTPSGNLVIYGTNIYADGSVFYLVSGKPKTNPWQLISLQTQPENINTSTVLSPIMDKIISIWSYTDGTWFLYDPENPYFSDLESMEAGKGYWLHQNSDIDIENDLSITGTEPARSVTLSAGWNLVGYNSMTTEDTSIAMSSIEGSYISIWAYKDGQWLMYDPANPVFSDLETMEPGYGYWINASEPCTWTLP